MGMWQEESCLFRNFFGFTCHTGGLGSTPLSSRFLKQYAIDLLLIGILFQIRN